MGFTRIPKTHMSSYSNSKQFIFEDIKVFCSEASGATFRGIFVLHSFMHNGHIFVSVRG